jgi:uncharacterized membrane protein
VLLSSIHYVVLVLEFVVSLLVLAACAHAGWQLIRGAEVRRVRLTLAQGLLSAFSLFTATALLATAQISNSPAQNWERLGFFVAVLGMRTLVKYALQAELASAQVGRDPTSPHPA